MARQTMPTAPQNTIASIRILSSNGTYAGFHQVASIAATNNGMWKAPLKLKNTSPQKMYNQNTMLPMTTRDILNMQGN